MAKNLCPDRETQTIGLGAAILALALQAVPGLQWVPLATGALVGALFLSRHGRRADDTVEPLPFTIPKRVALACGVAFIALLAAFAFAAPHSESATFVAVVLRAGSLVFGGGHVVLPLLQSLVGDGLISARDFYAGYGAVQAMPGPIFTFASFLGMANLSPLHGALGALIATVAIFAPSFLLVFALAPVWNAVRVLPGMGGALRGANASVVGLLGAVLYDPIVTNLGTSVPRLAIALAAFALVVVWKLPPWVVVVTAAAAGVAAALAGTPL
jgi:chromate transporter